MKPTFAATLVTFTCIATDALSQSCGCDLTVPLSGEYQVEFNEKVTRRGLSSMTITAVDRGDELGVVLEVSGEGASATLTCDANGVYSGVVSHLGQTPGHLAD